MSMMYLAIPCETFLGWDGQAAKQLQSDQWPPRIGGWITWYKVGPYDPIGNGVEL